MLMAMAMRVCPILPFPYEAKLQRFYWHANMTWPTDYIEVPQLRPELFTRCAAKLAFLQQLELGGGVVGAHCPPESQQVKDIRHKRHRLPPSRLKLLSTT